MVRKRDRRSPPKKHRCGAPTGKDRNGPPCKRWVVDRHGPCDRHDKQAHDELAGKKARVLELLEEDDNTVADAAHGVGVNRTTIWRWRQADAEFDKACAALESEAERLSAWEGSVFKRILKGTAAPAVEIFYVINLSKRIAPGRWQHVQNVQQSNFDVDLSGLPDDALERIANGEDAMRVVADVLREQRQREAGAGGE